MPRSSFAMLGMVALGSAVGASSALAQPSRYVALGTWESPTVRWGNRLAEALELRRATVDPARPPGRSLQPRALQILEDALLRKYPRLLRGSRIRARELVLRRYQRNPAQLRGIQAEALFLDRNPDWRYVSKPNASQHDVYLLRRGLPPRNGQVKVHASGDPSLYARDMIADHRAHRFFVPDDHVEALREHLRQAGRFRDAARVSGTGFTYAELEAKCADAVRAAAREKYAGYISLGMTLGLSVGGVVWDAFHGRLDTNQAGYHLLRSGSLVAVGVGADQGLRFVYGGVLRGTLRGNVIVAVATSVGEIGWLLYEHGWRRAFYEPSFYEAAVGGVSAAGLGLLVGTWVTGLAAETGWWAPVIGGGAGLVAGTAGYIGGRTATRWTLEVVAPEMMRKQERLWVATVRQVIETRLDAARAPIGQ